MAEDTKIDALSWSVFIDRIAGPLRLEPSDRQSFGLLMSLHLVGAIWGDLAQLRAAARLRARHHFDLDRICGAPDEARLRGWYRHFLARQTTEPMLQPLPQGVLKPTWTADGQST